MGYMGTLYYRLNFWKSKAVLRASLLAQQVKNPPAIQETQETWVHSLSREDALEEGMAAHSSILPWRIPMDRGAWWATVHKVAQSWTRLK